MSIELKQAAQQALEALTFIRRQLKSWDRGDSVIDALRTALSQQPATPESVQADSSEHLRVVASMGDALRRLSFAAQTTGGTAGPDAELQSAIGQAEQALSLGGIWQAMSATGEPVGFTYQAEIAYADSTGGNGSFWRVPPDLDDEAVPLYTHPAPSVRADVVRVPLQVLKDASEALGNFVSDHGWGDTDMQAMDNLDAYIARHEANRAAMLAAK